MTNLNKKLEDYLNLVVPQPLEEHEYIRLWFKIANPSTDKASNFARFVKTFEEVEELINKYKFFCDCFISLSTYRKETSFEDKPTVQYRRQVIFVDFDKKDYPHFKDVTDYSHYFKKSIPWLHNHCIVASGSGGYHFYIATEVTTDIEQITSINKTIVKLSKADDNAASKAQVGRIPTSYNLKDFENKKAVKVVSNSVRTDNFKPYNIQRLENRLHFEEFNRKIEIPEQQTSRSVNSHSIRYYCVENMLNSGCKKGERNFALGRIIAKLKNDKHQKSKAKETVMDWNKRCNPPKSEREVEDDFERYWNNSDYKLLGCNLPEGRRKEILRNYCNKALCKNFQKYEIQNDTENIVLVNDTFLNQRNARRLKGLHYLIILMVSTFKNQRMRKTKLFALLEKTKNKNSKIRYSKVTLQKAIDELISYRIISEYNYAYYELKQYNPNYTTSVRIKISAIEKFVYKKIGQTEFKVYLVLNTLLQSKNSATYDEISEYLDMEKSSISEYIKKLNKERLLKINKVYNIKGQECNRYTFL